MKSADLNTCIVQNLSGWGNFPSVKSKVYSSSSKRQILKVLSNEEQVIPRGLGRSYADQAINAERGVLMMKNYNRFISFDEANGLLICEGGTSLKEIIDHFAPRGWFPLIVPGTKFVTIGGAIANDIHGKAHHVDGSFSNCVKDFTLLLADGSIISASREKNTDIFWASFGGLGLLGIILTASIQLRKIGSTFYRQKSIVASNLDELLNLFDQYDHQFNNSVAWINSLAGSKQLGRGVLTVGDIVTRQELPSKIKNQLAISPVSKLGLPFYLPNFSLNKLSVRLLNSIIHTAQRKAKPFVHYEKFLFPLDVLANWNRGYGRRGFIQYQFVIPLEHGRDNIRAILEKINESDQLPFLNVLKKFGKGQPKSILSFPQEGYTFAIDFPVKRELKKLIVTLDQMVIDYGGKVYLGKDAFLTPESFRKMYPNYKEWLEVKKKYDSKNKFSSNISRRIKLEN